MRIKYLMLSPKRLNLWGLFVACIIAILFIAPVMDNILPFGKSVVTVTQTTQKNPDAISSEVWIYDILVDGKKVKLETIKPSSAWKFNNSHLVSYAVDVPSKLVLTFQGGSEVEFKFLSHNYSGIAEITVADESHTLDLYSISSENSDRSSLTQYITFSLTATVTSVSLIRSLTSVLVCVLTVLILTVAIFLIFVQLLRLKKYLDLHLYGIPAIALKNMSAYFDRIGKTVLLSLSSLYIAFALGFDRLFMDRTDNLVDGITITLPSALSFLVLVVLSFVGILIILYILNILALWFASRKAKPQADEDKKKNSIVWWVFFAILMLGFTIYLVAFYPAIMTLDSADQWEQAVDGTVYNNAHPVFHTLLIKLLVQIWNNPACVSLAQMLFLSAVCATFLRYLWRRGLPLPLLCLSAVVFVATPITGIYVVTLWKDVAYTTALLWLTYLLTRIVFDENYLGRIRHCVALFACLVFVYFFRHNGIGPYILAFVFLTLYAFRISKKARYYLLATVATSLVTIILIAGPIYSALKVISPTQGPMPLITAIGSTFAADDGEKLSAESKALSLEIMPAQLWRDNFRWYSVNQYLFYSEVDIIANISKISTFDIFKAYLDAWVKYPRVVLWERLMKIDVIYNLNVRDESRYAAYSKYSANGIEPYITQKYGFSQKENALKDSIGDIVEWFQTTSDFTSLLISHAGLYVALSLILYIFLYSISRRYAVLFIPLAANTLTWILFMEAFDYRYVWYVLVIFQFLLLVALSALKENGVAHMERHENNTITES